MRLLLYSSRTPQRQVGVKPARRGLASSTLSRKDTTMRSAISRPVSEHWTVLAASSWSREENMMGGLPGIATCTAQTGWVLTQVKLWLHMEH